MTQFNATIDPLTITIRSLLGKASDRTDFHLEPNCCKILIVCSDSVNSAPYFGFPDEIVRHDLKACRGVDVSLQKSIHEEFSRAHEVKQSSDRSFGLVFSIVFAAIGLWPLLGGGSIKIWPLGIGIVFAVVAFVAPHLLAPANWLWQRFGLLLNRFVSPIILSLMFFVVLLPFGLFMRLTGRDFLNLKFDSNAKTYWIKRNPGPAPETMKKQF